MYLRAGGNLEYLRRILGHSRIETTLIYVQLVTDDLAAPHALYSPVVRAGANRRHSGYGR
jgi:site-specific recombinase XerD